MSLPDANTPLSTPFLPYFPGYQQSNNITSTGTHYKKYITLCEEHGIKAKAQALDSWSQKEAWKVHPFL